PPALRSVVAPVPVPGCEVKLSVDIANRALLGAPNQSRLSRKLLFPPVELEQRMAYFLQVLSFIYIGIGALNSLFVSATVGINKCAVATGVVSLYCNTGVGFSHFISTILWPLFWF